MSTSRTRVVVGMSGGVDSSVTAALLLQQGYEVLGVTMKVWPQDCLSRAEDKCCGPQAVADARAVADTLGIPHYVVDDSAEFERTVIRYFTAEYRQGRTPNPCILCNELLKFGSLRERAHRLGADFVATGHYARIEHSPDHATLRRGLDPRKDQSYFLFSLRQEQLRAALTPIGAHTKPEIRELARQLGLKTHDKQDSQEICFVPDNDYAAFLRSRADASGFQPGGIYDLLGQRLGDHHGIENYTVGQRKGLPGGSAQPLYVLDIDPVHHRVIVGRSEDLMTSSFQITDCNWILPQPPGTTLEAMVKIRYNHAGCPALLHIRDKATADVSLPEPQRAVTPGQAAVFYNGDLVLGGGWIARHSTPAPSPTALHAP